MSDRMLRVRGAVQGVGFRPFVLRLSVEFGVRGWVCNDAEGVLMRLQASAAELEAFAVQLVVRAPGAARVSGVEWLDSAPFGATPGGKFGIIESRAVAGCIETDIPVDLAVCGDCLSEMNDREDRRYGYPFINCTQCGPRYTLIERLPYDRPQTTMACFQMCPACQREYDDPQDRRFHAEPNACAVCGPHLRLTAASGCLLAERAAAFDQAVDLLRGGGIVAVKGMGGFHLMVDATNEAAVAALRRRKHREEKPFGVMFLDLRMLRRWAEVSMDEEMLLKSPPCPMVLVRKRSVESLDPLESMAASVAPGNPWLGALLPSAPLHGLLLARMDCPLVATSANLADEPLCTDDDEARQRLAGIADVFLGHDRAIVRPADDSIVRHTSGGAFMMLRRARGYAPAPFLLPSVLSQSLICVGAQMKNTVAVASGRRLVLSPHIGDLGDAATHRVLTRTIDALSSLLAVKAETVVCDKHPDYHSTRFALHSGLPCIAVQHHLAHVLAVLLEHGQVADGVLGVAWDGTGYGEDGTIWGGEFILLDGGRASRFARFRPFRLVGGEAAVRDSRRVAVAMADLCDGPGSGAVAARFGFSDAEAGILQSMMRQGLNSLWCSSVGRLFDGVGALLGLGLRNAFEGQVPLAVEAAAMAAMADSPEGDALSFPVARAVHGARWEIDWAPAVSGLLEKPPRQAGLLAAAFHRGLVDALIEICHHSGVRTIVLSGGCFQNGLLRDMAESRLLAAGFLVLVPRDLPAHDGGIAAGQALGALWDLTTVDLPAGYG